MKKAIIKFLSISTFGKSILTYAFLTRNYLKNNGWMMSVQRGLPVDKEGKALPWLTYPIIKFLDARLHKNLSIFEFGSGNSTIWFSDLIKNIVSVEHDNGWYNLMKEKLKEKANIKYLFRDLKSGDYHNEILNYNNEFDIVIIDGRNRVACSRNALGALKDNGVIVWDNSERGEYKEGYDFLVSKGFKRLDFWGIAPMNSSSSCTSVFYKNENCLNI